MVCCRKAKEENLYQFLMNMGKVMQLNTTEGIIQVRGLIIRPILFLICHGNNQQIQNIT